MALTGVGREKCCAAIGGLLPSTTCRHAQARPARCERPSAFIHVSLSLAPARTQRLPTLPLTLPQPSPTHASPSFLPHGCLLVSARCAFDLRSCCHGCRYATSLAE